MRPTGRSRHWFVPSASLRIPYTCRRAAADDPFLRELVVPFGGNGYVVLFHIGGEHVTLLALRHHREDDYFL